MLNCGYVFPACRWPALLTLSLCLGIPGAAHARSWTDKQGVKITANFVRVQGNEVVLQRGFDVVRVPLANLSKEDQDYVEKQLKAEGMRFWNDLGGKQILARPVRMDKGSIELKSTEGKVIVPFGKLSYEDQEFIREWLAGRGESELLPKPEAESRLWTDETGRKVFARLESVRHGGRLKLLSYGVEVPIAYDKLSDADQKFLREHLKARGEIDLLSLPSEQVATANPPPRVNPTPPPVATPPRSHVPAIPSASLPRTPQPPYAQPRFPVNRAEQHKICDACGRKMPLAEKDNICQECNNQIEADNVRNQSRGAQNGGGSAKDFQWNQVDLLWGFLPPLGFVLGWLFMKHRDG